MTLLKLEHVLDACPLCRGDKIMPVHVVHQKVDDEEVLINYVQCAKCGLLFQNPAMDPEQYMDLYANGTYKRNIGSEESNLALATSRARHQVDLLRFMLSMDLQGASVLDIGCGHGFLLSTLRARFDANILGVEIQPERLELLRQTDVPYVETPELALEQMNPNLIVLSHNLEHWQDPKPIIEFLEHKVPRPVSVFVEVPYALSIHGCRLWHPCAYTREALLYFFQRIGVNTLSLTTHSLPHSQAEVNLVALGELRPHYEAALVPLLQEFPAATA